MADPLWLWVGVGIVVVGGLVWWGWEEMKWSRGGMKNDEKK